MASIIIKVPWTKSGPDLSKPPEGITEEEWEQWPKDFGVCPDQDTGAMNPGDMVKVQINYVPSKITDAIEKLADAKGDFQYVETVDEESAPSVKAVTEIVDIKSDVTIGET